MLGRAASPGHAAIRPGKQNMMVTVANKDEKEETKWNLIWLLLMLN